MVLNEIAWAFKNKPYTSLSEFSKDVQQYQIDILGDDDVWKPNEVVIDNAQVKLCYEAWLQNPKNLLKNESLTAPLHEVFNDEVDEDEYRQVEVVATFDADNGICFTAQELLMKLNNVMANKELGDQIFFEGLEISEDRDASLPTFVVICGS